MAGSPPEDLRRPHIIGPDALGRMDRMIALARRVRRTVRFRAFTIRLAVLLRRNGGRLVVDAPHGAHLDGPVRIRALPQGGGGGTTTVRFGADVRLGRDVTLELWAMGDNLLELGDFCAVSDRVLVQLRSAKVTIGDRAQVRDAVILKSQGVLRVGRDVVLGAWSALHCARAIDICDGVGLGERVSVLDSDHTIGGTEHYLYRPLRVEPVVIGERALLGANTVVTRGARIGRDSAIGAGAVVGRGSHPDGWLLAGAPARPIRALDEPGDPDESRPAG